ncbi:hypothetical protein I6I76_00020 [Dermacoccus nishinomiyaensis]|uniref:hypothetical protein n=1 Tax=Dermacoccus nishinomiyaensis TaxID=1274 RepID=UPI00192CD3CC|nr:hypothetical protein [Dermacoccus nishinomiyaensis]QQY24622.1 hypothetical protein I6I76_00020 [Dermacoccus nishinomiyaensis]
MDHRADLAWCLTLAIAPDFACGVRAVLLVLHVAIRPIAAASALVLVASAAALVSRPDGRNVGTSSARSWG